MITVRHCVYIVVQIREGFVEFIQFRSVGRAGVNARSWRGVARRVRRCRAASLGRAARGPRVLHCRTRAATPPAPHARPRSTRRRLIKNSY